MTREFELTVIVKPSASQEQQKQIQQKVRTFIEQSGGVVLHQLNLGRRNLSYEIAKESRAIYLFWDFLSDGKIVSEIERFCRYDDFVVKFLTVQAAEQVDPALRQAAHGEDRKKFEQYFGVSLGADGDVVAAAPAPVVPVIPVAAPVAAAAASAS